MARKTARQKESYGSCTIGQFSPAPTGSWPLAINIVLSFEEAMKLNLAIQARLLNINRLNRSTKAGKAAAVNLCAYRDTRRITVNAATLK